MHLCNLRLVEILPDPDLLNRGPGVFSTRMRTFTFLVLALYLTSLVLEGPTRFALSLLQSPNLLYVRDLLLVLTIGAYCTAAIVQGKSLFHAPIVALYALSLHLLIAVLAGQNLFSALFGLKVYFGLVFGLVAAEAVSMHDAAFKRLIAGLWFVCVIGVITHKAAGSLPWEGMSYDTAFGAVEASKQWWSAGAQRLSGFARASYNAAMIAGVAGAILIAMLSCHTLKAVIATFTIATIYLTTTKGMLLAFVITATWLIAVPPGKPRALSGAVLITLFGLLVIGLPVAVIAYGLVDAAPANLPSTFLSLWDRFTYMWPRAFEALDHPLFYITGKGLGSIGTPQVITGNPRASYADNFFVYQFVAFGVMAFVYIFAIVATILKDLFRQHGSSTWSTSLLFILFIYGITANMLEEQFFSMLLGVGIGVSAFCAPRNVDRSSVRFEASTLDSGRQS